PAEVDWRPDRVVLGQSWLSVERSDGRVRVTGALAGALPGCRWAAAVDVQGPARVSDPGEPDVADHEWSVVTAVAHGEVTVRANGAEHTVSGRAYVDRNGSDRPLHALGVARWHWGRLAFADREVVWYAATDDRGAVSSRVMTIDADGRSVAVEDAVRDAGRGFGCWGLGWPAVVSLPGGIDVPLGRPIDDSPFYARFRVDVAGARGEPVARGFAEVCRVDRIDRGWFRPLLRMTVCPATGPGSIWLPLFAGPRDGRWARLVGGDR
ncbi:MAG: hypothetical protein ABMB14_39910, partial [Myxococcota bacterium]